MEDSIINALNLKVADFPSAFDLLDQNNKVAVAYRNWEYDLIGTDLSVVTIRLSGFELVLRSDIFDELLKKYNGNVYRVSKEYIH